MPPPDYSKIFGQFARKIDKLEKEVAALRKAQPTATPSRPHPQIVEDFIGGNDTSGSIGEMGWTFVGGTVQTTAPGIGHPGLRRFGTGAVAGTLGAIHVAGSTTAGVLRASDPWTIRAIFRTGTTVDADTMIRVGVGLSPQVNPPADGAYIEKLLADTTFFGVCRASAVQTRSQILTTAGAAMTAIGTSQQYRVRIRRRTSAVGFTLEAVSSLGVITASYPEVLIATNLPATLSGLQIFAQVHNGAVAAARFIDLDWFEVMLSNMGR